MTRVSSWYAGRVDAVLYRLNKFGDAIERGQSALTWQATNTVENLKATGYRVQSSIAANVSRPGNQLVSNASSSASGNRVLSYFTVPFDTTFARLLLELRGSRLVDVMRLNPGLIREPVVKSGTVVRYLASPVAG